MKKLLTITVFTLVFSSDLLAQSLATNIEEQDIKWIYNGAVNQLNNETLTISGYFITKTGSIEWVQQSSSASETDEMLVTSKIGSWADVNKQGQIQYNVSLYGSTGKIIIKRTNTGTLTLVLEFTGTEFGDMRYLFELTNFETIN